LIVRYNTRYPLKSEVAPVFAAFCKSAGWIERLRSQLLLASQSRKIRSAASAKLSNNKYIDSDLYKTEKYKATFKRGIIRQ